MPLVKFDVGVLVLVTIGVGVPMVGEPSIGGVGVAETEVGTVPGRNQSVVVTPSA